MAEGEKNGGIGGGERGEESVKLFVGQVPKQMTEAELLAVFKEVALVDEVNVIKDKVNKASRGCCFVICPSQREADKAVDAFHNKRTLPGTSGPLQVKYADGELERLEHKLFIGMLPKNISDAEVSALFSKYGNIKDLQILRGSQQSIKAGCAFLKYETKYQALAAIEALNRKHKMEGSSLSLVVKWADTEKERQVRRAQKAQSQASNIHNGNSLQQPSPFGTLPICYISQYSGFGYQPSGTYGFMQYHLASTQNLASFHNTSSPVNQGNVSQRTGPTNINTAQSGGFIGSAYPTMQGPQYPMSYPISHRPLGNSHGSLMQPGISDNGTTSPSMSTSSGGQIEGPPGANLFIYHIPHELGDGGLANAFQGFGRVLSAKIFVDKATGLSKCFGFVSYDSPAAAQAAINVMDDFQLGGKRLKVQLKRDNKLNKPY